MANLYYRDYTPNMKFAHPHKPTYVECIDYLKQFLSNFNFFTTDELSGLENYWTYFSYPKNSMVVSPGKVCSHILFLCSGAIKHCTKKNEELSVVEFMTECNFVAGLKSFIQQTPAQHLYTCTKQTVGLQITYENWMLLKTARPAFEKLFNLLTEDAILNIVDRLTSFQKLDSKGRYLLMLKQHPDIFINFSMQDISNYLGIKAETLSRLKKEMTYRELHPANRERHAVRPTSGS